LLLISLCGLLAAAIPPLQEEKDSERRLWNAQFEAARARAKNAKQTAKPGAAPAKASAKMLDGELIGIAIWRLSGCGGR
jgi:hypothetical protein